MQRRFSLQITLSNQNQTIPTQSGLSQQKIKKDGMEKTERIAESLLDEDRYSECEISNYSFYDLNQDLYKKLSI